MSNYKVFDLNQDQLQAGQARYAIVAARFNDHIVGPMLDAAVKTLQERGATEEQIEVSRVPGAFELAVTAQHYANTGHYQAIICLGCVIRGDTPHFDYVCEAATQGLTEVSLKTNLPIIFGVLTTDNEQQALDRSGAKPGENKGVDAAMTAMEMVAVCQRIDQQDR